MAVGLAAATANAILNALCRSTAWTEPAELWIKIHTGDPGAAGTSNAATETDRIQATFGTNASGGAISNTAASTWTSVAATETYTHVSVWDASTSGNFIFSAQLAASKAVDAGDDFTIPIGDIDVTLGAVAS
jgi:hypothetical protein